MKEVLKTMRVGGLKHTLVGLLSHPSLLLSSQLNRIHSNTAPK